MTTLPSMVRRALVAIAFVLAAACSRETFPVSPTPTAPGPAATVSGGSWSGLVGLDDGRVTPFNMTLIARGLGATTSVRTTQQNVGSVDVAGNFATDSGLKGTVSGNLQGTLQDGTFSGTLHLDAPACGRAYAGPITESSVAWLPTEPVATGCPLTFLIQLPRDRGPDCQYQISVTRQSFSGDGGSGEVAVTTGALCAWVAESPSPWIRFADTSAHVGSGRVAFTVMTGDPASREGQIRVAGSNQTFAISQGPGCGFAASPSAVTIADAGGTARVALSAPDGCAWTARSSAEWLAVAPADGAGNATLTLTAQLNRGSVRQATVTVGGQSITVTQGLGCYFSVTPTTATVPLGGGSGAVTLSGAAGECQWTAESEASWLTVTPAAGAGDATLTYNATANVGATRQGTLRVAGQLVTIVQGTCASPVVVTLALGAVPAAGTVANANVSAAAGCPWTAASSVPWVSLSSSSGVGPGAVVVTVAANTARTARQGSLTIGDQTFTVSQGIAPCSYALDPTSIDVDQDGTFPEGLTVSDDIPIPVTVTSTPGCTWNAVPEQSSWIRVSVTATEFRVTVDPNPSQIERLGAIVLTGGQANITVFVHQAGQPDDD